MKLVSISLLSIFLFLIKTTSAQVPLQSVVEHFTNSNCSICASNNPSIYTTLSTYPNCNHIAIHPSSPYANCYFSLQNPAENDARTNFYGLYGGTPKTTLNGVAVNYWNLGSALTNSATWMTAFQLNVSQQQFSLDSVHVFITIKKVSADTTSQALLFAAAIQDTVMKLTGNGENLHHDVFRKSLTATTGNSIVLPLNINDTLNYVFNYKLQNNWFAPAMKALVILQKIQNKEVLQSAKSGSIQMPTGIEYYVEEEQINLYPNPSTHKLILPQQSTLRQLSTVEGNKIQYQLNADNSLNTTSLSPGVYLISLQNENGKIQTTQFVKQ